MLHVAQRFHLDIAPLLHHAHLEVLPSFPTADAALIKARVMVLGRIAVAIALAGTARVVVTVKHVGAETVCVLAVDDVGLDILTKAVDPDGIVILEIILRCDVRLLHKDFASIITDADFSRQTV